MLCIYLIVAVVLQYLTELTLLNGETFLKFVPSVIASSAVFVANETLGTECWVKIESVFEYI